MNAELPPFRNGKHNSENASTLTGHNPFNQPISNLKQQLVEEALHVYKSTLAVYDATGSACVGYMQSFVD